jgi:2-iminobutanoate/2-iminopropanoate deaminase
VTIFDNPATVPAPPPGRYSHVARIDLGGRTMLVLSGQVAVDAEGRLVGENDMRAQAAYVLDTIEKILAAHGATLDDVVNIRTFVTDIDRLAEYAEARIPRFSGTPPTSTTVEVSGLFVPGALLEVEVTAVV